MQSLSQYTNQAMSNFQRRMNDLFDDLWSDRFTSHMTPAMSDFVNAPAYESQETDSHYLLSFDLPGVKREDIKVDLTDGILTVSGERKEETIEKGKGTYRSERAYGSFQRSFRFPQEIKLEQAEASYKDGVLRLVLPKTKTNMEAKRQIKIGEGKPSLWDRLTGREKAGAQTSLTQGEKRPAEKVA